MEAPAEEGRAGYLSQPREISQQLQSYVTWVNSQLKKKPEVQPVQDLRRDLRDGLVLTSLIEIVAGEKLRGVEESPTDQQAMKENVEKVLQFVASKKIRMHQTSAKDIVDGNLKCIMRLVLALAAHFKPGSGKIASAKPVEEIQGGSGILLAHPRPRSAVAVAQEAVAALAEVRQDVSGVGRGAFQPHPRNSHPHGGTERPHWSVRALVQQYEGQQSSGPSESSFSSLTSPSPINSAKSESGSTRSEEKGGFDFGHEEEDGEEKAGTRTEPWSQAFPEFDHRYVVSHVEENGGRLPVEWSPKCPAPSLETSWEEHLLEQQDHLEKEMEEAKRMISGLQALLLNGSLPEDEQERSLVLCEQEACPEEQLVIIRSRLDQSLEENQELKVRRSTWRYFFSSDWTVGKDFKGQLPHSHSTPAVSNSPCTKVLYFTDRSLTPFMVSIPKRLGEVTLRDFKSAIDRDGTHRYHFKALDPEFGTVKEEVFHDDDVIPGWEGKIVAWVEEDHGEN
ncbi:PREDICTED: dixin [Thamnophis sirtalis]|uniref:Dixin n=1 Tax=Thamnophis sirtalis TaxID=35019 RepID=A0A6I9XJB7_9SAUR|nr:PREDICTED: dixin [Thamnophis sirtalis]